MIIKKILLFILLLYSSSIPVSGKTIDMGEFKITAYCPCQQCSEGWGRKTASQTQCKSNHTIAVDPNVIDLGSKVKIENKTYVAEDTGGAVQRDIIDVFFDTHEQVVDFGTRYKNICVIH